MKNDRLPGWIERYLQRWFDPYLLDGIFGDLLEEYTLIKAKYGKRRAQLLLLWNTLGLIRYRKLFKREKVIHHSPSITPDMLLNHFIVSIRNLLKNRVYTLINVLGLTLSFACCLLIGLYVQEELSYDQYHEKADRIYRLAAQVEGASYENGVAKIFAPWGPEAAETIPEVEEAARFVFYGRTLFTKGEQKQYEYGGLWADSTIFDIFSWPFIYGNPETALSEVNTVVLTRSLAEEYFPNENPIGQSIVFENEQEMTISGVIENIPDQSHFTFNFLVPIQGYTPPDHGSVWNTWNQYYTYLLLGEDADVALTSKKIDEMLAQHLDQETSEAYSPLLQAITDIHLRSNLHREMSTNSDISYVIIFSIVAILTLLIALTNFTNLFTARATRRAKEIGVRKIVGAHRRSIIGQFIMEALLVTFTSGIFAVILAHLFLPSLNLFLDRELVFSFFNNPQLLFGLLSVIILAGLLSGSYPAFLLSNFKANRVLKADAESSFLRSFTRKGPRAIFLKSLVVIQFCIANFLIIAALVVNGQLNYIQNKKLGFNKEQIISVPMSTPQTIAKSDLIKEEILKIPGVERVSASANRPGGSDYGLPYRAEGVAEEDQPAMRCLVVDEDFLETYEIELAEGRGFQTDMSTDSTAYLINETAAAQLGWDNPLEHQLSNPVVERASAPIIGVVKDFHFHSLHEPIGPIYFFIEKTWFTQFSIKINAERMEETLDVLRDKWPTFEPNHPFRYTFFDQAFESLHAAEVSTAQMIRWFTYIAIFITCLGLFGLSAYTSERRTKEIGIRKVFGASVGNILVILIKEVLILVLIAIVISMPIAWIISRNWLSNFAYTIDFGIAYLAIAATLALGIALLAVSLHVIRSARLHPIRTLRYE